MNLLGCLSVAEGNLIGLRGLQQAPFDKPLASLIFNCNFPLSQDRLCLSFIDSNITGWVSAGRQAIIVQPRWGCRRNRTPLTPDSNPGLLLFNPVGVVELITFSLVLRRIWVG